MKRPGVVVVGMGPVGLVAALALARQGVAVTVLEAGATLAAESRASTFHPPSLEYLADLAVSDELHQVGLEAPRFQQRDRRGGVLLELDLGLLAEETAFPYRLQSEQDNLTRIIAGHLAGMDHVELRFASPVVGIATTGAGVTVETASGERICAEWLIGADGASSVVRRDLGVDFDGMTYPERFFVISTSFDFQLAFPDLAPVSYISDPEEWMVLLRTPRHWRALFPVAESEAPGDIESPEAVQGRLQGVFARDEPYPVLHTTLYNVHQRLVSRMAVDRVLLAGDAAHINNPLGGLGMNSGIHDAVAASRVIVAALGGADPASCAAVYDRVRRSTVSEYVLADTARNFSDLANSEEEARAQRAADLARLAADPDAQRAHLRRTSMLTSAHHSHHQLGEALAAIAPAPSPVAILRGSRTERDQALDKEDEKVFTHMGMLALGGATAAEVEAVAVGLASLVGEVSGLRDMRTFLDAGLGGDFNASIGFVATFDNEQSWRAYGSHPAHLDLINTRIAPFLERRSFVQASVPGPSASI